MPEAPDLEAIRGFLNGRIRGESVLKCEVFIPVVLRIPRDEFVRLATGDAIGEVHRHGKFLIFALASGRALVINPMLTGRFAYVEPAARRPAKTCFALSMTTGLQLRYSDERLMGRIYLVPLDGLAAIPQFAEMGPDLLSSAITEDVFVERLRHFNGMIKNVLVNHRFVAGIGNAYADEILWQAGIHPYRKRAQLKPGDAEALFEAMRAVMAWALPILAEKMSDALDYSEWRDHLRVHRRGGQPCPRCGGRISEVTAGQRITSFCRACQP